MRSNARRTLNVIGTGFAILAASMILLTGCNESHEADCKNSGGEVHNVDFRDANGHQKRSYYCTVNGKITDRW